MIDPEFIYAIREAERLATSYKQARFVYFQEGDWVICRVMDLDLAFRENAASIKVWPGGKISLAVAD